MQNKLRSEDETLMETQTVVLKNKSYTDAAMSRNTENNINKKVIVFGDIITWGIKVRDFNQQVKNDRAKLKYFPGYNSK